MSGIPRRRRSKAERAAMKVAKARRAADRKASREDQGQLLDPVDGRPNVVRLRP